MHDIITKIVRAPQELVDKFAAVEESASIYEVMKKNALPGRIKPIWPGTRMCGTALTVYSRPGDNLMVYKALDMLQPGDVLVVSYDGYTGCGGLWGGMMSTSAKAKGAAGFVTDGAVRDSMLIKELDFPVFCAGRNVQTTTKSLPGKINHPIIIGDVVIHPGDIVYGDNDAVIIIPKEIAEEVYIEVVKREERESLLAKRIMAGEGTAYHLMGFDKAFQKLNLGVEE
ncbi:RraA family protein [Lachnospiraceae bacterium 62-35]